MCVIATVRLFLKASIINLAVCGLFLHGGLSSAMADNVTVVASDTVPRKIAPVEKLYRFAMRYLDACVVRDSAYIAAHSVDDPMGSYAGINSGPDKKWGLSETVSHFDGLKKVFWEGLDPKGFVLGDFAWFIDDAYLVLPSGDKPAVRLTLLMRKIKDDWRVYHYHLSAPVYSTGLQKE